MPKDKKMDPDKDPRSASTHDDPSVFHGNMGEPQTREEYEWKFRLIDKYRKAKKGRSI